MQLNQDDESEENTEVTWGMCCSLKQAAHPQSLRLEDQQKISLFSKLNSRCTDLEEKITKQKVFYIPNLPEHKLISGCSPRRRRLMTSQWSSS